MYPASTSQNPPMSQPPTKLQSTPNASSYANVTSSTCFPKKDQAIILDSIDGITLREYLIALSSITPTASIRFISRISNARICIYMDSKKTADNLIEEKKNITIKNNIVQIKPLITRNKRIVLSNVCPVIPNYVIEEKFQEFNIKMMSPLTFMKIGVTDPGFSHILSFRRQLYISPDDEKRLPESFQITFEGTNYWIYTSTDALKCFNCNTLGHLAKNCPQTIINIQDYPATDTQKAKEINETFNTNDDLILARPHTDSVCPASTTHDFLQPSQINLKGKKRIHSPTITESSKTEISKQHTQEDDSDRMELETDETSSIISLEDIETQTKTKKKLKKTDPRTDEEIWKNIEDHMTELNNENSFPINLDQYISLLDSSRGKQNIKELVYSYTDDIKELIKMCNKLHCKMNKSLKNRCSRLSRKLHEMLNPVPIITSNKDQ